jgi:metal-responsive CopG/Arc/MetJ family transcriptional regulator
MIWAKEDKTEMPRLQGQFDYDEKKKRRGLLASDTAWARLEQLAKAMGYRSRSDLIEGLGREGVLDEEELILKKRKRKE